MRHQISQLWFSGTKNSIKTIQKGIVSTLNSFRKNLYSNLRSMCLLSGVLGNKLIIPNHKIKSFRISNFSSNVFSLDKRTAPLNSNQFLGKN